MIPIITGKICFLNTLSKSWFVFADVQSSKTSLMQVTQIMGQTLSVSVCIYNSTIFLLVQPSTTSRKDKSEFFCTFF